MAGPHPGPASPTRASSRPPWRSSSSAGVAFWRRHPDHPLPRTSHEGDPMSKLTLLTAAAVGSVLGARAGASGTSRSPPERARWRTRVRPPSSRPRTSPPEGDPGSRASPPSKVFEQPRLGVKVAVRTRCTNHSAASGPDRASTLALERRGRTLHRAGPGRFPGSGGCGRASVLLLPPPRHRAGVPHPVPPGTGWPDDPRRAPRCRRPAHRTRTRLRGSPRSPVLPRVPRLVRWREDVARTSGRRSPTSPTGADRSPAGGPAAAC